MSKRRVVVTGLGLVTSLGHDVASSWSGIVSGKSGVSHMQEFDASEFPVTFAGEVKNFDPLAFIEKKDVKKMDGCIHYAIKASIEAIADSGLDYSGNNEELSLRTGVSIGSGIGGLTTIQDNAANLATRGPKKISPFFIKPHTYFLLSTFFILCRYDSICVFPSLTGRRCG